MHSAIQVFRPPLNERDHDGLDGYRHWIYVTIALIPVLLSTLPFAMSNTAYQLSNAFCQLPPRPIWYRLALAWIPRYAIALFVITMTIYMYVYVGVKFRGFSTSAEGSLATRRPSDVEAQQTPLNNDLLGWPNTLMGFNWTPHSPTPLGRSAFQDPRPSQRAEERRSSDVQPLSLVTPSRRKSSVDEPRRASTITTSSKMQQDDDEQRRSSSVTSNSKLTNTTEKSGTTLSPVKELPIPEQSTSSSSPSGSPPNVLPETQHRNSLTQQVPNPVVATQRVDLQRQLRNNFVYPIIYVVTWTIPFIVTCMQFNPRYATNTPDWLGVLSILSLTSMGAVDCLAFLWKEKPWRTDSAASLSSGRQSGRSTWLRRGGRRVSTVSASSGGVPAEGGADTDVERDTQRPCRPCGSRSRSGDRQKMVRQRALERLALEQQDRKDITSGEKLAAGANRSHKGRKEWWDVRRISSSTV